jgi:hypothetical protein
LNFSIDGYIINCQLKTTGTKMSFIPHLFVGIGETQAFFTLRETYLHTYFIGERRCTEVRSFHHQNLAQDPDEAFAKAEELAEKLGLPLTSTRESMVEEMRDIKRADAAEKERRAQAYKIQQEQWELQRLEREYALQKLIDEGKFPYGKWIQQEFLCAGRSYLNWLVKSIDKFDEGSLLRRTALRVQELHADIIYPDPSQELIGQEKQRLEMDVLVTRVWRHEGYYGVTYITTMIEKETKACVVSMSGAFNPEEGANLRIKATVKCHDDYKGQMQTRIQRVSVINK